MARTRWRLQDLQRALAWLDGYSDAGISKVLKRLGFSRKQALAFVRSPDPEYQAKWQAILTATAEALARPGQVVLLYLDEMTYYRRPTKAPAYVATGKTQPRAVEAPQANTQTRLVAVLNHLTGQVLYLQRSKIGYSALLAFYALIREAYPEAETIYLVEDNWPVHKHDPILTALQQQRLTPLFLPTYASWLNPIEKLWKWLRQDVLHLHPFTFDLDKLRELVTAFLDQFAIPSPALRRYVGLLLE